MATTCPRCFGATLQQASHDGQLVHACTACAGVWLSSHQAATLLAPLGSDLVPSPWRTTPLSCPSCGSAMAALHTPRAGVEIDRCHPHGAWFDRDEIAHVVHAITSMQGRPPPAMPGPYRSAPTSSHWGTAAVGGAVVGGAVVAGGALGGDPTQPSLGERALAGLDGVDVAHATVEVGGAVVDGGEIVGGVAEAGGAVLEGAGSVLGSLLGAIGDLFS